VDDIYDQFVRTVSENRKLPLKKIEELADGRIFSGRQALELGLVDDLGGLQDAILLSAKLAGIEGKPAVSYAARKRSGLLRYLLEGALSSLSESIGRGAAKPTGIHYLYE
jgi:protease-4